MPSRKRDVGRPGALEEARELVALVASLSEAGDALSAAAVAERLGVDAAHAEKLMGLVLSSTLVGGSGLPLVEEQGELALVDSGGIRGRSLRLTRNETLALMAALDRLGVDTDDPLRARLASQSASEPIDEGLVRRLISGERSTDAVAQVLGTCARARAQQRTVSFTYRKSPHAEPERRTVAVTDLRIEDDAWYLTGTDLDRGAVRTFRVDRMGDIEAGAGVVATEACERDPRTVRLSFSDPRYLTLLPWHGLLVTSGAGELPVRAEIPYFGGAWLARMLAACGGTARCDDPAIEAEAQSYARDQLERA